MALLMYGCGLRMGEVLNLRIKDIVIKQGSQQCKTALSYILYYLGIFVSPIKPKAKHS